MEQIPLGRNYRGEAGEQYFAWQDDMSGRLGGMLKARAFAPFIDPASRIADFGCGAGWLLAHLDAAERVGIEPAPAARQAATQHGFRVVASATELEEDAFDQVISSHALEHTVVPCRELQELRRVLRPGGELRLHVPLDDWRNQKRWNAPDTNHHLYAWTPLLLGNLASEAGFAVRDVRVISHAWPLYHHRLARLPPAAWDLVCGVWSRVFRIRQLELVANA